MNYKACPECEGFETECVYRAVEADLAEFTMLCDACEIQYTAKFSLFARDVDRIPANEHVLADEDG